MDQNIKNAKLLGQAHVARQNSQKKYTVKRPNCWAKPM